MSEIPMEVLPMLPEIQNGIAHQLPGTVKGHVAAAFDLEHPDAAAHQLRPGQGETGGPGASSQGNHRLVLNQEQDIVRSLAVYPLSAETALELQYFGIS